MTKNLREQKKQRCREWHKAHRTEHCEQMKQYSRSWRASNIDAVRQSQLKRKMERPENYLLAIVKSRAKKKGIEFNLTSKDIKIPEFCPVLGIKLVIRAKGQAQDDTPSLDRIDSNKGYVKGNVLVVSTRANVIKNKGTPDEHQRIAEFYRQFPSNDSPKQINT